MTKYLVTTALEETWPENGTQVLFFGEWCKIFSRKSLWGKYDHSVLQYHWDDRGKLYNDYLYLKDLHEILLAELAQELNQIHDVNFSLRYWRILTGPWLGWFVQMLFDRWYMLKSVINESTELECIIISREPLSLVPNDMTAFCEEFGSDNWNEGVCGQLIYGYFDQSIGIKKVQFKTAKNRPDGKIRTPLRAHFNNLLKRSSRWINGLTGKHADYFFLNSYLPWVIDWKAQWKLGQFPKFWPGEAVSIASPCPKLRDFSLGRSSANGCEFLSVARKFIPMHIPKVYLEGYKGLLRKVNECSWPEKPKGIFTSNSYFADDFFKLWAAEKTEKGSRLFIGQHGGNFGMSKFAFHEDHQIEISDRWFSWGWKSKGNPKIVPVGNIKTGGSRIPCSSKGGGLLVAMELPRYSYHLYSIPVGAAQWISYFQDQVKFLSELPLHIRKSFKVRPHKGPDLGNCFKRRVREHFKEIIFDSEPKMETSALKNRLFVSTYNSTTYLESLTWNIPTIVFWNPLHWELNDCAQPYFSLLKEAGIFHEKPHSAAQKVSEVWDDVGTWWKSEVVQRARFEFCNQYSRQIKNIDEFTNHLMD